LRNNSNELTIAHGSLEQLQNALRRNTAEKYHIIFGTLASNEIPTGEHTDRLQISRI
jgi:hypothetical protein